MEQHTESYNNASSTSTMIIEGVVSSTTESNGNASAADTQTPKSPVTQDWLQNSTIPTTTEFDQNCWLVPEEKTQTSSNNSLQEENSESPNNEQLVKITEAEDKETNTENNSDNNRMNPHMEQTVDECTELDTTLKQVYGMLCWLLMDDNVKQWRQNPLAACVQAIKDCPHLENADAERLRNNIKQVDERRQQILKQHGGKAECVPRETRLCSNGPLFVIVDHVLSGNMSDKSRCAIAALIRVHALGDTATSTSSHSTTIDSGQNTYVPNVFAEARTDITSAGWKGIKLTNSCGGPIRRQNINHQSNREPNYLECKQAHRHGITQLPMGKTRQPNYQTLLQRARKLTAPAILQMEEEMQVRREITIRDARLMVDLIAMRRREYEMKELKVREFLRALESGRLDSLEQCEDYIQRLNEEL
ncbi:hypothetical protein COEREDRAFT_83434 [Coemansia reversa NRRL 1564]|uniref:Uncharacterized protein n=1 Tax=Coemansia reversa (strain ATCC 12441 / NRRL 1564) TaxID=763665 RepID=A0A2G5B3B1_COERN|nr:hypothetical protein COEREDRAFT_83434 [Coemansia reversa NRRL 1564]|eukprot:PIA13510.1 hypothetical protein COEREDRAFT_83434 [Coemansia reversa NRRL 1564]